MKKKNIEWEITKNKKAYFDYEIVKTYEAWIELKWYEVKSIRNWNVNLKWNFIVINKNNEAFIKNMHIAAWKTLPNKDSIDTFRERKIFLHKKDIEYLASKIKEKWYSIIGLKLYFKWSLIKLLVWLVKWKKKYDKKQTLKERTMKKEAAIAASRYL